MQEIQTKYPEFNTLIEKIADEIVIEISGKAPKVKAKEKLVEDIADAVAHKINNTAPKIQSKMPYKCQFVLEETIKKLKNIKDTPENCKEVLEKVIADLEERV